MKKLYILILFFFVSVLYVNSQNIDTTKYKFKPYPTIGFDFIFNTGIWGGTVPATPIESTVSIPGTKYYAPAFGININYHFIENLSFYFDINMYTRKTPVAYKNSYASSFWIFEQTGYNSHEVGPFDEDVFYNIQTTGFRLGLKAYLQHKKNIQPWFGIYWGYYQEAHGIYNKDKTQTYGNASNYVTGLSYINFGADIWNKTKAVGITFFVELGTPVNRNYSIENCLVKDWTFEDYGEGEHIFGYYRIGISLNSIASKKSKKQK